MPRLIHLFSLLLLLSIVLRQSCAFTRPLSSSLAAADTSRKDRRTNPILRVSASLATTDTPPATTQDVGGYKSWPCGDALDKRIMALALPAMLNFAILPLVGAAGIYILS